MIEIWMGPASLPSELEWVLAMAAGKLPSASPDGLNWSRLEAYAAKNRLQPLVLRGLKELSPEEAEPRRVMENFAAEQNRQTLLTMVQMQTLANLSTGLEAAGVRMISLKGPLLAMELYESPELRYSRDLDILVPREDLNRTCALLEDWGFQEEITVFNKTPKRRKLLEEKGEEMHRVYRKGGLCIEVHWRLSFRWDESFENLWTRRREKSLFGQTVPCLGELDDLCYLICHAAGHGFQRLRWLMDLYIRLNDPGLALETLCQYMVEKRVCPLLLETLLVLHCCPGLAMEPIENRLFSFQRMENGLRLRYDPSLKEDVDAAIALVRAVWPLLAKETDDLGLEGIRYTKMLPNHGKKEGPLGIFLALLRPRKGELELVDLPDCLYFLYYFIRPMYKVWRMTPFSHAGNQCG